MLVSVFSRKGRGKVYNMLFSVVDVVDEQTICSGPILMRSVNHYIHP